MKKTADEEDYFHDSRNGVSGVRSTPSRAGKSSVAQNKPRQAKHLNPILQGIMLGTVLLIPVGAWYWMRSNSAPVAVPVEGNPKAAAGRSNKSALPATSVRQRKPLIKAAGSGGEGNPGASPVPGRVTGAGQSESAGPPPAAESAVRRVPPATATTPTAGSSNERPAMTKMPSLVEDTTVMEDQPKKSVWKKLASPFRGGSGSSGVSKDRDPSQPEDPSQP